MSLHRQDIAAATVAVELVIFCVLDADLKVRLHRRVEQPFEGTWALPGGGVRISHQGTQGENLEDAARRALTETTGVDSAHIEQLYTFGRAGRVPGTRVISVAWCVLLPPDRAQMLSKSETSAWFSASEDVPWMRLAFDHAEILQMGVERLQSKLNLAGLAFELVPETFTVAELRDVHEAVHGKSHDHRNFRRRFQRMVTDGLVLEAPGRRHLGKSRPAKVWRLGCRLPVIT